MVALVTVGQKEKIPSHHRDIGAKGNSIFNLAIPHWLYECLAMAYNIPSFIALIIFVLRYRPDFIYERYSLFTVSGLGVAKIFRLPFILEVNAPLSLEMKVYESLVFQRLAQRVENWLCRNATKTIVVSSAMKNIFLTHGLPEHKFMVLPNGVDPQRFHPEVNGKQIRTSLDWTDNFIVGFVGWIRHWHGLDILIDAMAILEKKIAALRLLLVGDGPAMFDLQTQIHRLGLTEKIQLTGPVPKNVIPNYIAAMDLAIQPAVTDYASPIKLFEYLAIGKAIIAPRKDNITEIIEDEKQALLYTSGKTQELADKIARLYNDRDLRESLGREGRRLVKEKGYYWQANASKIIACVELCKKENADDKLLNLAKHNYS